jgi:hypothetical protein
MTTEWSVTTATDHVAMDATNAGEVTFTVTNLSYLSARLVFDVIPGEKASGSWFTVEEPQRQVPAYGSAQFHVRITVPAGTPAGAYSFQGRAYSVDNAPEESSRKSVLVTFDVAGPRASKTVWQLAAAVAILLVVVALLGFCQRRM